MDIINEKKLISILKSSKNVLLIEPPYTRKYIPLGLAKISSFVKSHCGKTTYSRGPITGNFDLICIATMFTNDSKIVLQTIKECKADWFLKDVKIIVGGIFSSLMPEYIYKQTGVSIFTGYSKTLDSCLPDYSINYGVDSFFKNAMTLFTTRGCINKCPYCMVWRMEPNYHICSNWQKNIENIDREICVVSDNSFLSAPHSHIENVINCLNKNNKKVIFNNGMNCREINDENAKLFESLKYIRFGFRIGFDRIEDDGHYQNAMEKLIKAGLKIKGHSYTYILFNFDDTPQEAYYRAQEAWKYGSNPYLMRYRPLNQLTRKSTFIGKYWTKNLIRAFSNYGQNYGYNRGDKTFESWVNGRTNVDEKLKYKLKLTNDDWDKWNYRR